LEEGTLKPRVQTAADRNVGMDFPTSATNEQTVYTVNHALLILSNAAAKLGDQAPQLWPKIV
jgi:hypothetical protein